MSESSVGFKVIEFETPKLGIASPINRTNTLFVGKGRTAGGAREFVIPNQVIPKRCNNKNSKMMKLLPAENLLQGSWYFDGSSGKADAVNNRIEWLVENCLTEIGVDESGWNKLYVDPSDGRYWELTYPESEVHGGGPLRLQNVQISDVSKKYGIKT